jgi:hypothetical protein
LNFSQFCKIPAIEKQINKNFYENYSHFVCLSFAQASEASAEFFGILFVFESRGEPVGKIVLLE